MSSLKKYKMHINGKWENASSNDFFESENPYTGKPWALIPNGNAQDVDKAVQAAHHAFRHGEWSKLTATQRGRLLYRLGDLIQAKGDDLAQTEVRDNGKLIAEMSAQLKYMPQWYYYFGGLADKIEGAVLPTDKAGMFNFTVKEPLGVVALITPWNSPLNLTTWKLAPALAAGNTIVIKPSEFTSASILEMAELFEEAGFPPGVINIVTGYGKEVGQPLVVHPLVSKVAFTGSETGGVAVYQSAAKKLIPVSLELGGKSPNIIFEDANLESAMMGAISGIFAATGQTCIAGSRLLVQKNVYDELLEKLVNFAATAKMGDPSKMETQVGPITTIAQYQKVLDYIDIAKKEGVECVLGGHAAREPEFANGRFIEPTIFSGVNNKMQIAREEVFGPVLCVIPFEDEEEAIHIANDSEYGLASGVWTKNMNRALRVSSKLEAGTVWVNTYRAFSFTSPFGGYKRSGIGRESGQEAIQDFLQTKSVWINTSDEIPNPFIIR